VRKIFNFCYKTPDIVTILAKLGLNMKTTLSLLLLSLLASCEMATVKYGYFWNPVKILSDAKEAVENNSVEELAEVLSDKALCVYGSESGLANIQDALSHVDSASLREPVLISAKHLSSPNYIGYFSYYQEIYEATAKNVKGHPVLKVRIVCDYGRDNKDSNYLGAPLSRYTVRSCAINDIRNFKTKLSVPEYCL
jgi:hypothetical protein